ncbi:recombinase family protein [Clostridium formicaceticum]|uniref:recombinase family protein n=1 Tax=Clostridium formicaceticum TaxID=1497 RepID=UPI0009D95C06|nr:recombinase family protein [Clostridium formicaceticum]
MLRNGKTKLTNIKGKKKLTNEEDHIVHYDYYPPIVSKADFNLVQEIVKKRSKKAVRAGNEKIHIDVLFVTNILLD